MTRWHETYLTEYLQNHFDGRLFPAAISNVITKHKCSIFDTCDLAVAIYRIQNEIKDFEDSAPALKILSLIQKQFCCCEIYYSSTIGSNFLLVHGIGTVIGPWVKVGNNVTVYQDVTLGTKYDTDKKMCTIGDDVIIYAGAKVLGEITVSKGAVIGANSVVIINVGENEIVAGAPAKRIGFVSDSKYKLPPGNK